MESKMDDYLQCPCHDCGVVDQILAGATSWDCACEAGPTFDCTGCPRDNKCPAQKDLENCPKCNSWEGLKFPRTEGPYCEDCGWPHDNR